MSARSDAETQPPPLGRRAIRREATKAEIVGAAWELVTAKGLAGLAMRDLGDLVGMKAQSIYSYFASKNEIYDAMFREGYEAFASSMADVERQAVDSKATLAEEARLMAHSFFEFCTSDPVRYQLLFQRTIPDFEPSEESYAVAVAVYQSMTDRLAELGIDDPASVDLLTAMLTGLTDQQISNDPGGDRWERIIDRAIDMLVGEMAPDLHKPTTRGKRS